jgi:phage shock protein A
VPIRLQGLSQAHWLRKQKRATEIDEDLKQLVSNVSGHKTQIQSLMRELDRLKEEKHDAVATVLSASEEKQIADMMTGLTNDRTSEELHELRELRQKSSASARISRELAGLDTKKAEAEFLEYTQASEADDEFDALIGLAKKETPSRLNKKTLNSRSVVVAITR